MAESSKNVITSQTDYICDACQKAPVAVVNSIPYPYVHICPNCKTVISLPKVYPYITYK